MASYSPYVEEAAAPVAGGTSYSPYVEPAQAAEPAKPRTLTENVLRQLGLTARAGITGITGGSGAIADALASGANMLGANMQMPSEAQQKLMTRVGLPQPENTTEKVVQALGSMVAGAGDPTFLGAQAASAAKVPAGFGQAQQAAKIQTAKELSDAGFKLAPNQVEAGLIPRGLEGLGGPARIQEALRFSNENVPNQLAIKALNLPPETQLTAEVLKQQAQQLVKDGYDPIKAAGTITTGSVYRNALKDIHDQFSSKSFPDADKQEVLSLLQKYNVRKYEADDAVKTISMLRQEAKDAFKPGGDSSVGLAKRALATALENNIELNLQARGANNPAAAEMLDNFRAARVALAKNDAVERMLVDPNTGQVSTVKAAALLKAGVPLTGELQTIAKAGSPMFSKATSPPTGGKPSPFNTMDITKLALGSSLSPFTGGYSAAMTALPLAGQAARSTVLSPMMQRMMMKNAGNAPSIFGGPVGQRLQASAPMQLLPLFSQGEQ